MKSKIIPVAILTLILFLAGCKYDNYDPPKSFLTGKITYNNTALGVRSGGNQLELWQYGFALRSKIAVYIDQDGSYSALLFNGNYKLVSLAGAPWVNQTDSIDVKVSGNTVVDVPVTPFFTITGETYAYTAVDSTITATCSVTKVGTSAISSLTLYASSTTVLDANNNMQNTALAAAALTDLTTAKTVKVKLSKATFTALIGRKYVYVRLGVATSGVGERLYTAPLKITLP